MFMMIDTNKALFMRFIICILSIFILNIIFAVNISSQNADSEPISLLS